MDTPIKYKSARLETTIPGKDNEAVVAQRPAVLKDFITVTKPGIIRSNLLTTFVGLWLASNGILIWPLVLLTLLGTGLIIASGCIFNNYLDRDLDGYMSRTKSRPTVVGALTGKMTVAYGTVLGIAGFALLALFVNLLAAFLGLLAWVIYVILYTPLKRTTTLNTVVGAFSGAAPPLIGWSAVTESLGLGAWVLFAILFLWQHPHFFALGIRRAEEYRAAGFAMLPVVQGTEMTKRQIALYTIILLPVSLLLYVAGEVGVVYLISAAVLGVVWIVMAIKGFFVKDDVRWAKSMFFYSLVYLLMLNLAVLIDIQ